jgi:acetyl esterase
MQSLINLLPTLPARVMCVSAQSHDGDTMAELHPQMVEILDMIARDMVGKPKLPELSPVEARRMSDAEFTPFWNADAPPVAHVADRVIPGPYGPIPVRIYDPGAPDLSPGLVYIHGGGWVICNLDSHDGVCRRLANHSGLRVISIDYRLAPEHKFPLPLEDCVAVLRWIGKHGRELGIDPERLAVTGDSAGGNLALAVAMALRDQGGPALKGVGLIYGAFDVDFDTRSYRDYGGDYYYLSRQEMLWYWDHYLRDGADRSNPLAVPGCGPLDGLPPLLVIGAEFDPLLDDSRKLVERLKAAGAPHEWILWPGVVHGCIHMTRMLEPAEGFLQQLAGWLRRQAVG